MKKSTDALLRLTLLPLETVKVVMVVTAVTVVTVVVAVSAVVVVAIAVASAVAVVATVAVTEVISVTKEEEIFQATLVPLRASEQTSIELEQSLSLLPPYC